MRHRSGHGVPQILAADVLPPRRGGRSMQAHRRAQTLDLRPERLYHVVVQQASVHGLRVYSNAHESQLGHDAARFLYREVYGLQRQQRDALQPARGRSGNSRTSNCCTRGRARQRNRVPDRPAPLSRCRRWCGRARQHPRPLCPSPPASTERRTHARRHSPETASAPSSTFRIAFACAKSGHSFHSGNTCPSITHVSTPVTSLRRMTGIRARNGSSR